MGLTSRLFEAAAARPHVLLLSTPGGTAVRLEAERVLAGRGWPRVTTPAAADVLLQCGRVDTRLADAVDRVWNQLPGPRARTAPHAVDQVEPALDEAQGRLRDLPYQRADASERRGVPADRDLTMVDAADDRDGLMLEQLHPHLGPVLPDWPAGLVLRVALQGDVVQFVDADVWGLPLSGDPFWCAPALRAGRGAEVTAVFAARRTAAAHLDSVARLLGVAGWTGAATEAARLRADVLAEPDPAACAVRVGCFARRVGRSRRLWWALRGVGVLPGSEAIEAGVSGPALRASHGPRADAHDRCRQWLTESVQALTGRPPERAEGPRGRIDAGVESTLASRSLLDVATRLMVGQELIVARLVLASFDPDPEELLADRVPVSADG